MLSLIEVKCPHCGARGQLMLPPMGAIIIGPCPECSELVVVFCGHVLPLSKEIMLNASFEEKQEHIMTVLTSFLEERVAHLLKEALPQEQEEDDEPEPGAEGESREVKQVTGDEPKAARGGKPHGISEGEMSDFVRVDLNLIDNKNYFKAIFG